MTQIELLKLERLYSQWDNRYSHCGNDSDHHTRSETERCMADLRKVIEELKK